MDTQRIRDLLAGTTNPDPSVRQNSEQALEQIHKIIGFTPKLLEIVRDNSVDIPIRQAAAIYIKNNVGKHWENHLQPNDPTIFVIHDHDKNALRDSIVDAIIQANQDLLSVHLIATSSTIMKADFPSKWPGVVDKILFLLQQNDVNSWNVALLVFYQLAKIHEYRNTQERKPFLEALRVLMPSTCQRMSQVLQSDPLSEQSCKVQHKILKIFHAIIQYSLPQTILTREVFNQWMAFILEVAKRDIPDIVYKDVAEDDRPGLIWWKCKKWAFHLLSRIFERYGSPNNCAKEYKDFAKWYIETFSVPTIQTIIKTFEQFAVSQYVSPRVMQQALNYLNTAVLHSMTWKMLKNDMMVVIEKIIFPLMSYTAEDEELFESDPQEYVRVKFDVFEEYVSPVSASSTLLYSLCKKRRDMLQKTMTFLAVVLNNPQPDPRPKDGALHMIGSISTVLLKKPLYKDQLEQLITNYILPNFTCNKGLLRARACWALSHFINIPYQNPATLKSATTAVLQLILVDKEIPVRVEAALCLQALLSIEQDKIEIIKEIVRPNIENVVLGLSNLIKATSNEDVMEVMQKCVYVFPEETSRVAIQIVNNLVETFYGLIRDTESGEEEEKTASAMCVLTTLDTILTMMDEMKEVIAKLEPLVINVVIAIFDKSAMELYEEATTLLSTITADAVSPESWKAFQALYIVFKRDGCDYFTDMMSPIHNYITVDPQTFISSRDNMLAVYEMSHQILTDTMSGEEIECYAAKLLEVVILQFRNQLGDCMPSFIELAINRLKREIGTTELRTLLLQVIMSVFYTNYQLLFNCFDKIQAQNNLPANTLFNSFVKQWFDDIKEFVGLHDRKMCMIGICSLIMIPENKRPPIVNEISGRILPAVLDLFDKLKIAYEKSDKEAAESESEDEDDDELSESDQEVEDDDKDVIPNSRIENSDDDFEDIADGESDLDYDDEDELDDEEDEDCERTALETFETLIDTKNGFVCEFSLFRNTMERLREDCTNPNPSQERLNPTSNWYNVLLAPLNEAQRKKLVELGQFAEAREMARWKQANEAHQQQMQQQQIIKQLQQQQQ